MDYDFDDPIKRQTIQDRLMSRSVMINGCRLWQEGLSSKGYGMMNLPGSQGKKHMRADVLMLYYTKGQMIPGLQHKCKNKLCILPNHMQFE